MAWFRLYQTMSARIISGVRKEDPTMTQGGGRWPGKPLPVEEIAAAYRAGAGIIELAHRWSCSQSGIRSVLRRAGVVMRPRGGVRRSIADEEIVRLRDVERMAWADMAALTGLTDVALKLRYDTAVAQPARYRWQRSGEQHPDLSPARLTELNTVIDHRDDIVADYVSGRTSARELARIWGISDTTVRRWAARRQNQLEQDAPAQSSVYTENQTEPATPEEEWVIGDAQRELEAWTSRRRTGPDSPWCTPTEAAEILHLSPERVRQLIYDTGVLPTWVAAGGKRLLRRTDVHTAARLAGKPGTPTVGRHRAALGAQGRSAPES